MSQPIKNYKEFGIKAEHVVKSIEQSASILTVMKTQLVQAYTEVGITLTPEETNFKLLAMVTKMLVGAQDAQAEAKAPIPKGSNA